MKLITLSLSIIPICLLIGGIILKALANGIKVKVNSNLIGGIVFLVLALIVGGVYFFI